MNSGHSPLLTPQPDNLFGLVFDAAPSGMLLVNGEGSIVLANTQAEHLFGYTRQELLGQPIEILIPEQYRRQHPDHLRTFFQSPSVRAMGQGRDLSGQRKDGTEFPIEIGLNPVPLPQGLHVLTSIIDITERKQSEEALQRAHGELEQRVHERTMQVTEINAALQQELIEHKQAEAALRSSQENLRQTLQASNTGLWHWNTDTQEVTFSKEWKGQLGYTETELSDTFESWEARLHPGDRDRAIAYVQAYLASPNGDYRQEFRLRHKDGTYRWTQPRLRSSQSQTAGEFAYSDHTPTSPTANRPRSLSNERKNSCGKCRRWKPWAAWPAGSRTNLTICSPASTATSNCSSNKWSPGIHSTGVWTPSEPPVKRRPRSPSSS